jgi:transposase
VFVDESGFQLLPSVVKTWAPRGQTPILHTPLTWKHLSVIGGITLTGKLFSWVLDHAVKGDDLVFFLRHLLKQIPGKVLVIWDGLPAHRSLRVKDFLAQEAQDRLWLVRLPAYAPDLNPIEALWSYLKQVALKNLCCPSLAHLRAQLRLAIERLRHKRHIILSCFKQQLCYL